MIEHWVDRLRLIRLTIVVLINEFAKVVLELPHSIRGNENLEPGTIDHIIMVNEILSNAWK